MKRIAALLLALVVSAGALAQVTTNPGVTGVVGTNTTGSGSVVLQTSPTLVTPALGVATATSITFPSGTALANYTTWASYTPTVTLVGGAGNTVPVYTTNSGRWLRIGNAVFVDVYLTGDGGAEGAGSGAINIALPATAGAAQLTWYTIVGTALNGAAQYILIGQITSSGSTIALNYFNTIATQTDLTGALQDNTSRTIRISFRYEI